MFFIKNPPPSAYVVSSPLKGVLQKAGEPLANIPIIRKLRWNSNEAGIEQVFYTNDKGEFNLPVHEEILQIPALIEFVAKTDLYAVVDGVRDQFWFSSKMQKAINSEWHEPPVGVVCELTTELERVNSNHGLCATKCVWKNMPEEDDPYKP